MGTDGVYLLETYRFWSKFSRFMRSNPRTFPEFHPDKYGNWKPPRLAATWKPHKLIGDVWPENDYPGEGAPVNLTPVFSPRAVEGLREFLEPNGELLPVLTPLGTYYAFNLTTVVDALDFPESKRNVLGSVNGIDSFDFKPEQLAGLTIFKLPQTPVNIYVTEPFAARVRELGLNGMWITKLWPMPEGVRWQTAWEADLQRMRDEEARAEAKVKAEARSKPQMKPTSLEYLEKGVRAPKTLDLQKDVDAIEKLLKRVMKWIKQHQQEWIPKGERASAIGLETTGWDLQGGPIVMCHVDTRAVHGADGHWSHFHVAEIVRPQWSALARSLDDWENNRPVDRVVIDVRGKHHVVKGDSSQLDKWFAEVMVAALKQARANNVFAGLLEPRKCMLCAEDTDSGFGRHFPATVMGQRSRKGR